MPEKIENQVKGSLEELLKFLGKPAKILLASHSNPDGDAVGSTLGLAGVLDAMGHDVTCFNRDPVPELYQFLPGVDRLVHQLSKQDTFDATVVVDVFDLDRTGLDAYDPSQLGEILVIDHHLIGKSLPGLGLIDPKAAATGVLVHRLACAAGVELTTAIAENLFAAILTDTGSFRYSSANPEAFRIAGELVQAGVKPWEMASRIYENAPPSRLKLLADVLKTLEISPSKKFAAIFMSHDLMKKHQASVDLTDGFINYPRSLSGVEVAIFIRENPDGGFKASFRSRGRVDVAAICSQLGGGGHHNAAGCTFDGDNLETIKAQVYGATDAACEALV